MHPRVRGNHASVLEHGGRDAVMSCLMGLRSHVPNVPGNQYSLATF